MPRRVLICRIDPEMETPITRQFALDPVAHCVEHRLEMLAAACTVIRARFVHPAPPAAGALASFEDWDRLVRQTVVWVAEVLGFDAVDPMESFLAALDADPQVDALKDLLQALKAVFSGWFTAAQIKDAMFPNDRLDRSCRQCAGRLQQRSGYPDLNPVPGLDAAEPEGPDR